MNETASAVVFPHPPPAFLIRLANPVVRRLVPTRLGARMGPAAVLRYTGRRSGRQRAVVAGVYEIDGQHVVFTDRPWRLNFRDVDVEFLKGGRHERVHAELVEDPSQVGPALAAVVRRVGPRMVGLRVVSGTEPDDDDYAALGKSMILLTGAQ